jgi:acetyl-CoA C-acetyltransferase
LTLRLSVDRMSDVVICEPVRTPVGRFGGALAAVTATELATVTLTELVRRTGLGEGDVDDVVLGHCYPSGEAPAIGRIAALDAGLGTGVPGIQIDRRCGSGLQAVLYAAGQVATGAAGLVVAGGAESMSQVEHYALGLRTGVRMGGVNLMDRLDRARETAGGRDHPVPGGMLETAENLRARYGIPREEQDELAARSQQRAVAAQEAGRFDAELVPVPVPGKRGQGDVVVDRDEHPRPGTTAEDLGRLRPVRLRVDDQSTVTAGNASGQNDGAAMCVVTTRSEADRRGLRPMLALRSWAVAGVEPELMGIGPVPATSVALARAGLTLDDLDLIELNEAFAVQVLACLQEWKVDATDERLNPNGSGISLGHPVGATGARILATMAHEMQRRSGRYALETMCIGGGQGLAAVFEAVR